MAFWILNARFIRCNHTFSVLLKKKGKKRHNASRTTLPLSWYASINGHCIKTGDRRRCRMMVVWAIVETSVKTRACSARTAIVRRSFVWFSFHYSSAFLPPTAFDARVIYHVRIFFFISMWCPRLPITIIIIIFNANRCQGSGLEKNLNEIWLSACLMLYYFNLNKLRRLPSHCADWNEWINIEERSKLSNLVYKKTHWLLRSRPKLSEKIKILLSAYYTCATRSSFKLNSKFYIASNPIISMHEPRTTNSKYLYNATHAMRPTYLSKHFPFICTSDNTEIWCLHSYSVDVGWRAE